MIDILTEYVERKQSGEDVHLDHILPREHPRVTGLHVRENVQILTASENREKGNSFPELDYLPD